MQGLFLPTANGRNAEVCEEADWAPDAVAKVQYIARMHSDIVVERRIVKVPALSENL